MNQFWPMLGPSQGRIQKGWSRGGEGTAGIRGGLGGHSRNKVWSGGHSRNKGWPGAPGTSGIRGGLGGHIWNKGWSRGAHLE